MEQIKRRKALPSVCIYDIPIQFADESEARRVSGILTEEPLLEVVTEP